MASEQQVAQVPGSGIDAFRNFFQRDFPNFQSVLDYLRTLDVNSRLRTSYQVRDIMLRHQHDFLIGFENFDTFLRDRGVWGDLVNEKEFQSEWTGIRNYAKQSKRNRDRLEEVRRRVATEQPHPPGQRFVEDVIDLLCGKNEAAYRAILSAKSMHPHMNTQTVLQNGCKRMLRRLRGEEGIYRSNVSHLTPADITHGNDNDAQKPLVSEEDVRNLEMSLVADDEGLIWKNEVPLRARDAWMNLEAGIGQVEELPPTPGKPKSSTPKGVRFETSVRQSLTPTPAARAAPATPTHKYETRATQQIAPAPTIPAPPASAPLTPSKRASTVGPPSTAPKRTAQESPLQSRSGSVAPATGEKVARVGRSQKDTSDEAIEKMFSRLQVISKRAKESASQTGKLSKSLISWQANPISNPTMLEHAVWAMILSRVRALKENAKPKEIDESLRRTLGSCPPSQLHDTVKRVIAAMMSAGYDEPNLAVYTQSAFNWSALLLRSEQLGDSAIREAENLVRRYWGEKGGNKAFEIRVQDEILSITNSSAYTLVRSGTCDGKLDDVAIRACLLVETEQIGAGVIDSVAFAGWKSFGFQPAQRPRIPRDRDQYVLPYHTPDHWSLLLFDTHTRYVAFTDSAKDSERESEAFEDAKRVIDILPTAGEGT